MIEQVTWDGETAYLENDPVTGQPLMLRTSGGTQTLYIYDAIGNPEAMVTNLDTTAFAYDYDPYGLPTLTENSGGQGEPINPFQFKSGLQDRNTGWVKFGHRWYDPTDGRFAQRDTLDAPLDPANANRYTFAANDPINNSDPLGLRTYGECVGVTTVGGLAGGAATGFTAGLLTAVIGPEGPIITAGPATLIGAIAGAAGGVVTGLIVCE